MGHLLIAWLIVFSLGLWLIERLMEIVPVCVATVFIDSILGSASFISY